MVEQDIEALFVKVGQACNGHRLSTILSVMTYILADICLSSGMDKTKLVAELNDSIDKVLVDLKENNYGDSTHH
jgi:hypothetical protein